MRHNFVLQVCTTERYSQNPSTVPLVEVMCLQLVPAAQRPLGSVSQREGPRVRYERQSR